jgi:hypothetical protein
MPQLIGKRLDIAKSDLKSLDVEEEQIDDVGGGTFGAVDETNWTVCDQEPGSGAELSDRVRLLIARTCGPGDIFEASATTAPTPTGQVPNPKVVGSNPTSQPCDVAGHRGQMPQGIMDDFFFGCPVGAPLGAHFRNAELTPNRLFDPGVGESLAGRVRNRRRRARGEYFPSR